MGGRASKLLPQRHEIPLSNDEGTEVILFRISEKGAIFDCSRSPMDLHRCKCKAGPSLHAQSPFPSLPVGLHSCGRGNVLDDAWRGKAQSSVTASSSFLLEEGSDCCRQALTLLLFFMLALAQLPSVFSGTSQLSQQASQNPLSSESRSVRLELATHALDVAERDRAKPLQDDSAAVHY